MQANVSFCTRLSNLAEQLASGRNSKGEPYDQKNCDQIFEALSCITQGSDELDYLAGEFVNVSVFETTREAAVSIFKWVKALAESQVWSMQEPKGALARAVAADAATAGEREQ
jgi:hypothetical protein